MNIKDLKTKGYVVLEYPVGITGAVEKAVDSWKRFCKLPEEFKKSLPYSNGGAGVGYEIKDGSGSKADLKENFDVCGSGKNWLKENIQSIKNPVVINFVQTVEDLNNLLKPAILDFAKQVEDEYRLEGFEREVSESQNTFFTRFIHYFDGRNSGEETATAHVDQSGFTLHLYESAPGLQCLGLDGEWVDMPVSEGVTVIISAMQMQLRSEGRLKALCHRVVATDKTADNGRYSAVCFVQLGKTAKYNKEVNGRLQEKKPGFNYDMKYEEFKEMFEG